VKEVFAFSLLVVAGCARPQTSAPQDWAAAKSPEQKRAFLDALAESCSLPRDFFRLKGDEFTIRPKADEEYERVDCALEALKRVRPMPRYGFVGNEYYTTEKPQ
jgi:hypothetical protein